MEDITQSDPDKEEEFEFEPDVASCDEASETLYSTPSTIPTPTGSTVATSSSSDIGSTGKCKVASNKKQEGPFPSTPLIYWTATVGEHWYCAILEQKYLSFGMAVSEDGIDVHWSLNPPPSLARKFGLPEGTTEVPKIDGVVRIPAPKPIIEDASLVTRIPDLEFRILRCKFKKRVKLLF